MKEEVIKLGPLTKTVGFSRKRRVFVLTNKRLVYCLSREDASVFTSSVEKNSEHREQDQDSSVRGIVPLQTIVTCQLRSSDESDSMASVKFDVETTYRSFHLEASDASDAREWMHAIMNTAKQLETLRAHFDGTITSSSREDGQLKSSGSNHSFESMATADGSQHLNSAVQTYLEELRERNTILQAQVSHLSELHAAALAEAEGLRNQLKERDISGTSADVEVWKARAERAEEALQVVAAVSAKFVTSK